MDAWHALHACSIHLESRRGRVPPSAVQGLLQEVLEQQPADPMAYFCAKIEEIRGEMKESQVR